MKNLFAYSLFGFILLAVSCKGAVSDSNALSVTTITPASGVAAGGVRVSIMGRGFTGATNVTFAGASATSLHVVSDTALDLIIPRATVGAADVVVTTPAGTTSAFNGFTYVANQVGSHALGGTMACLDMGDELITPVTDFPSGSPWGMTAITGATSVTNGSSNTASIMTTYGTQMTYAAKSCADFEVDSAGNSPCEVGYTCYNDWFLPAKDQLDCFWNNRDAIGGFAPSSTYWSSTESTAMNAWSQDFPAGGQFANGKTNTYRFRCAREFNP